MFHYTQKTPTVYHIYHKDGILYKQEESNPLINEFGLYIIDKLHRFQNMQCYTVTEDTDIEEYVHEYVTLCDDSKIYRFSKELLAYLETCVAFSPYYLQNDPRTAGALETYYASALQAYNSISYEDLHAYLTRRLTAWYKRFPVTNKKIVVGTEEADVGAVVMGDNGAGAGPVHLKKPRYSLHVEDEDAPPPSPPAAPASPGAPPEAAVAAAAAAAEASATPE